MKGMFAIVLVLSCSGVAVGEDYGGIPEKFFTYIAEGKTSEAVEYLYGTNEWVAKNSDQVANLKGELSKVGHLVGEYQFHELIVSGKAGSRYAHLVYLVGYERQPLRFEIRVYKPGDEWRFQGVSFDMRITDDIEKLANQKVIDKME